MDIRYNPNAPNFSPSALHLGNSLIGITLNIIIELTRAFLFRFEKIRSF
jgi:hypothetical protein